MTKFLTKVCQIDIDASFESPLEWTFLGHKPYSIDQLGVVRRAHLQSRKDSSRKFSHMCKKSLPIDS
jgi:hypothetical protein